MKPSTHLLFLGLDWSVSSPAAAMRLYTSEGCLKHTWMMCFQQRRVSPQQVMHTPTETLTLTEFPMFASHGKRDRWSVLAHHVDFLCEWVRIIRLKVFLEYGVVPIRAYIEDYAYGVKKSQGFSKLAEDAGCAQLGLWTSQEISCTPVGISAVKKHWSGKGNATKMDMMEAYRRTKDFYPLHGLLRCHPGDNPYSDVVDALAVLETGRAQ